MIIKLGFRYPPFLLYKNLSIYYYYEKHASRIVKIIIPYVVPYRYSKHNGLIFITNAEDFSLPVGIV